MEIAMRALMVAAMVALLAGPAYAQMPGMGIPLGGEDKSKPTDPAKENEYNKTLKELPNQKAADPWGNVRSDAPAPKKPPAKSAAAPSTKTAPGTQTKKAHATAPTDAAANPGKDAGTGK
jgi:hypothetical protein